MSRWQVGDMYWQAVLAECNIVDYAPARDLKEDACDDLCNALASMPCDERRRALPGSHVRRFVVTGVTEDGEIDSTQTAECITCYDLGLIGDEGE
ncbi:MAG: hypothetical protein ACYC6N_08430 [Pirellulaceae bacterium]